MAAVQSVLRILIMPFHDLWRRPLMMQALASSRIYQTQKCKDGALTNERITSVFHFGSGGVYMLWLSDTVSLPVNLNSGRPLTASEAQQVYYYLKRSAETW